MQGGRGVVLRLGYLGDWWAYCSMAEVVPFPLCSSARGNRKPGQGGGNDERDGRHQSVVCGNEQSMTAKHFVCECPGPAQARRMSS